MKRGSRAPCQRTKHPRAPPSLLVGFHALILVTADERLLLISTLLTASPTAPPSVASGFTQTHGCHGSGGHWPRSRIRRRDAGRGPHCPRVRPSTGPSTRPRCLSWSPAPTGGQGRGPGNGARGAQGQQSQRCRTADPEARRTDAQVTQPGLERARPLPAPAIGSCAPGAALARQTPRLGHRVLLRAPLGPGTFLSPAPGKRTRHTRGTLVARSSPHGLAGESLP